MADTPADSIPQAEIPDEQPIPDWAREALLAEHKTLRDELLQRVRSRRQEMTATLILFGVFLTFCTRANGEPLVLLAYPLFAVFFVVRFTTEDIRVYEIGQYLRKRVEHRLPPIFWENWFHEANRTEENCKRNSISIGGKDFRLTRVAAAGIFFGSQVASIAVALAMLFTGDRMQAAGTVVAIALVSVLDLIALWMTGSLLKRRKR